MREILKVLRPGRSSKQIILFPFLGGYYNSYSELVELIDSDVEVLSINPPGHGVCERKPLETISAMVDLYQSVLRGRIKDQCVFFGHSMGGVVAYLLASRLQRDSEAPSALILSASNAPETYGEMMISQCADHEIIQYLVSIGGIDEALTKEPSLLNYFLPVFRADFLALESLADFRPPEVKLTVEAYTVFATDDTCVSAAQEGRWRDLFSRRPQGKLVQGGHMYIKQTPWEVAQWINSIFEAIELRTLDLAVLAQEASAR